MPLYEYQCATCQKVHEVMQKFSDAPLETCPDCGGTVSKLISVSSFALKGSGWYTTDYKRSGAPTAPAAAADSAKKPESTPAAATEKPASTTAAPVAAPATVTKPSK